MRTFGILPGRGLALTALLILAGWAAAAPAPEEAALREKALQLNLVTGSDAIRGQILTLLEDEAGAKKLLPVAVQMARQKDQPLNVTAVYILARVARGVRDLDAAQVFFRLSIDQAKKLDSTELLGKAYQGLADTFYEHKKYKDCLDVAQEFLEIEPTETNVQSLGFYKSQLKRRAIMALAKQGKTDEALREVNALVKRARAENWLVLELKGWVQREAGRSDEAAKTYEQVLALIQKDKALGDEERTAYGGEIRYLLSNVYVDLNQVDKAAAHLKALLEQDPDNPTYNNDLGYIWADHDMNLAESEKLIRKAIEKDRERQKKDGVKPDQVKDTAAYLDSLGWVLFKQKKYKEAKEYLLRAIKDPEGQHIEIFDHLAEVHKALGEKSEAVAAWKKGIAAAGTSKREQQRKAEVEKKLKANE
ncbi:MAG TPA: tetratricopeptide repeat protein [Gemmataceae bacterium]|nr:tetratricopeptide repeat protein [Gemmataceae bacterium]